MKISRARHDWHTTQLVCICPFFIIVMCSLVVGKFVDVYFSKNTTARFTCTEMWAFENESSETCNVWQIANQNCSHTTLGSHAQARLGHFRTVKSSTPRIAPRSDLRSGIISDSHEPKQECQGKNVWQLILGFDPHLPFAFLTNSLTHKYSIGLTEFRLTFRLGSWIVCLWYPL
jgi:hypothetical protein